MLLATVAVHMTWHSHTYQECQQIIGLGEWIWADSAYPIEAWCVTPYKKPAANIPENKEFNYWVSHVSYELQVIVLVSYYTSVLLYIFLGTNQVWTCCGLSQRLLSVFERSLTANQEWNRSPLCCWMDSCMHHYPYFNSWDWIW